MDAVSGTRRQVRELVDGTLEVRIHIDPRFTADFHRLFPTIDAPVALAPLVKDFERRPAARVKGGPISEWLGARCGESLFWHFLEVVEPGVSILSQEEAAVMVRRLCGVTSRAQVDHEPEARERFERLIRQPYAQYLRDLE